MELYAKKFAYNEYAYKASCLYAPHANAENAPDTASTHTVTNHVYVFVCACVCVYVRIFPAD